MSANDPLSRYVHAPGAPVLDRTAALLSLTHCGRLGSAIARDDRAVPGHDDDVVNAGGDLLAEER